jgi:hypothetical protein
MAGMKTRCKQCVYSKTNARHEPCSKCAEIQFNTLKLENHFLAADKNLFNDLQKER